MAQKDLMKLIDKPGLFMGAVASYEEADAVILGIPMDFTVSFRPGTRLGPLSIRNVSIGIEEYSVYQDKDLADYSYCDLGDLALPFGNVPKSLDIIESAARLILDDGKFPIFLGGEHLVSYPLIKPFAEKYPELCVVHFDAHADLREDYLGEINSHATVMRKVAEMLKPKHVYQFGIRSGTREEFLYAKEHTHLVIEDVLEPLQRVLPELKGKPVYVSLDIDVVDPAFAPGTGTQEAGGASSREILKAVHALSELKVVGFDLVEVSPALDSSERTALLAAKLVREVILGFVANK
ncbi:agmatinase [Paradesulfitobacterium ferrireducens]|uniref:agmatinase n=1 Tax=Paradesulfitobacterium ferrireducens TaxID=2816476 RepID=UPI001A8C632A|nr:agmatinase [Paradesulfitobacterium ferrireducens]